MVVPERAAEGVLGVGVARHGVRDRRELLLPLGVALHDHGNGARSEPLALVVEEDDGDVLGFGHRGSGERGGGREPPERERARCRRPRPRPRRGSAAARCETPSHGGVAGDRSWGAVRCSGPGLIHRATIGTRGGRRSSRTLTRSGGAAHLSPHATLSSVLILAALLVPAIAHRPDPAPARRPPVIVLGFDGFARRYLDEDSVPTFHARGAGRRDGGRDDPELPERHLPELLHAGDGALPVAHAAS